MSEVKAHRRSVEIAKALYDHGRAVEALRELNSGALTLTERDVVELVPTLLLAARWYQQVGYVYAAKYHALAALFLALKDSEESPRLRELVRPAALQAALCDYLNGSLVRCLDFLEIGLRHGPLHLNDEDPDTRATLETYLAMIGSILSFASSQPWDVRRALAQRVRVEGGMPDLPREGSPPVLGAEPVLRRPPFSDAAQDEVISWRSLGVRWVIRCPTEPLSSVLAEELAAVLQVACADLARWDLCIVPTAATIDIEVDEVAKPNLIRLANRPEPSWRLVVPGRDNRSLQERRLREQQYVLTLLAAVSWRPDFSAAIEGAYERDEAGTPPMPSYSSLYDSLVEIERWAEFPAATAIPQALCERVHPDLDWNSSRFLVDGHDPEALVTDLYRRAGRGTRLSLPRWLELPVGRETLAELRAEGWPDWLIVAGVHWYLLMARPTSEQSPTELPDADEPERVPPTNLEVLQARLLRGMMHAVSALVLSRLGFSIGGRHADVQALRSFMVAKLGLLHEAFL